MKQVVVTAPVPKPGMIIMTRAGQAKVEEVAFDSQGNVTCVKCITTNVFLQERLTNVIYVKPVVAWVKAREETMTCR